MMMKEWFTVTGWLMMNFSETLVESTEFWILSCKVWVLAVNKSVSYTSVKQFTPVVLCLPSDLIKY